MPRTVLVAASLLCSTPLASAQEYVSDPAPPQPGVAVRTPQKPQEFPRFRLERVSSVVPWPRGLAFLEDGRLVVVARGRHRNYGGPDQGLEDHAGSLFEVDPRVTEPFVQGQPASEATLRNGRVLARPDPAVMHPFDRSREPLENTLMGRPYCTLVYDPPSRNLFLCAYSGVDLPRGHPLGATFRKNATDALYRFDLRTKAWGIVEKHDHRAAPTKAFGGPWISNAYYPHHDPERNPPPHGLLNGPNNCAVVGRWLYAAGKDNHTLARYDLEGIRKDPAAPPPHGEVVLGDRVRVRLDGKVREIEVKGHSAVDAGEGFLYVGFRTSSLILRLPIDGEGYLVEPVVGELIAEFEPYEASTRRSADLWELRVGPDGDLYVTTSRTGRIWRFTPDPAVPFDGNDFRKDPPTPNRPFVDLRALTGIGNAVASNLAFDQKDRLYFCATMSEPDRELAGVVMRLVEE